MLDEVVAVRNVDWLPTLAAWLHLAQLPSMACARGALDWKRELARLAPVNRRLLWVFGAGIVVCVMGLAVVVIGSHGTLLHCAPGRFLCGFLAGFWGARATAQLLVLHDVWPPSLRWMHWGVSALYSGLAVLYACAIAGA